MQTTRVKGDRVVPEPKHMTFGATVTAGAQDAYLNPVNHRGTLNAGTPTEANTQTHAKLNREGKGRIKAIYVVASAAPGGADTYTVTLRLNGADTLLIAVVTPAALVASAGAAALAAADPCGVQVRDTDLVSVRLVATGGPGCTLDVKVELEVTG